MQPAQNQNQSAMLSPPLPSFTAFLPFAMDGLVGGAFGGGLTFASPRKLDAFVHLSQQLHLHDQWKSMAQSLLAQQPYPMAVDVHRPPLPDAKLRADAE